MNDAPMSLLAQLLQAAILAIPVACVAWTVTHEDLFKEVREWLVKQTKSPRPWYQRKFFYLFTCEYCFSHYVTIGALFVTRFTMLYQDWRGYVVAGFTIVWLANVYMGLFGRLRLEVRHERTEIQAAENALKNEAGNRPVESAARQGRRA
jgi:hypothetical protein